MTLAQAVDDYAPWFEHLLHRKVPEDLRGLRYSQVAQRLAWIKTQLNSEEDGGY